MKNLISIIVFSCLINSFFAQTAVFTDHGFIPNSLSVHAEFQAAAYNNGDVLIATTDGVWKNNIATQNWTASGLQGKTIICIYKHPTIANKLYAGALLDANNTNPLYISIDGGGNWVAASNPVNETYSNIVARPGRPNHLYAAPDNFNFMVSTDGGDNWSYHSNGSGGMMGYAVNLAFLPSDSNQLFYGSENPLDDARIDKYDVNQLNPKQLDNWETVVDQTVWGNRRPNKLHTYSYTGNNLFVGQEGGLSKVNTNDTNDVTFIYKSDNEPNKPYSYMYGHWTDPLDTNHLVFGGGLNGDNTGLMQLYETYDEGATFYRYTQTFGVSAPIVVDIVEVGLGKLAVVIEDQYNNQVKLIVMEQLPTSLKNTSTLMSDVKIYPNPTVNGVFNLETEQNVLKILLLTIDGALVKELNPLNRVFDVSDLTKSLYLVKVIFKKSVSYKKILVR